MQVLFVNNDGGGYASKIEVEPGTRINSFLEEQLGEDFDSSSYRVRVNRDAVASDYILKDGDRVTATPVKIEGAI